MDFQQSERSKDLQQRVDTFMRDHVFPAEVVHHEQLAALPSRHHEPPIMGELKARARADGLWNLFMPDPDWGPGLSNVDYAPLAESMGRSLIGAEVFNCNAPDTGNMELLSMFASEAQKKEWLLPLLAGEIRSCFLMTEPAVASSDATNMATTIRRAGDDYVVDGHKWFITNSPRPHAAIGIVMGVTDPEAPRHARHSMVLVPMSTPGVDVRRTLSVFGYDEGDGHAEVVLDDVRVPATNLIQNEGDGFRIAQGRLGPGRIHHCMRAVGQAERALQLMIARAAQRHTFGATLLEHDLIRSSVAESRLDIDQARLLTLHAAWLIDTVGAKAARKQIAMIKVAVPRATLRVLDRAIQVFGATGVSQDTPLAQHWAHARTLRIVDGPDEVHLLGVARAEIAEQQQEL